MIGVLTGDLINSRSLVAEDWIRELERVLSRYGPSPQKWEVFRGDSFQLEVAPERSFKVAVAIKAQIKMLASLDVRIGVGIGTKEYDSGKITTSNGSAYIHSGECFDSLGKKTLRVKTPWPDFDESMNVAFDLATLTMDSWTPTSSETIVQLLEVPRMSQVTLARRLNKSQSNVSEALSRGGFKEIMNLERYFQKEVREKCGGFC
ncbi:MAG: transcriptional regulator [Bacteroidota bacterium]